MGVEIERKFLVRPEQLPELPAPDELVQGYLSVEPVVRVRLATKAGVESAELTIKGKGFLSRAEFNYEIPPADARALLALCSRRLAKRRHRLGRWEIDHFFDRGLWLAEIELQSEDERFERPAWLGDEVTSDPAYANAQLATSGEK
jgi:adenylate cyclase